jgi:hypothetical protein
VNRCAWCDDPTEERLCPPCRAVNDRPPFYCKADKRHTVPTLGDSCFECDIIAEAKARRATAVAPRLESLRAIRAKLLSEEWYKSWPGMEFGKAMLGNMIDNAIRELES